MDNEKKELYGDPMEMIFAGILSFARQEYSRSLDKVDIAVAGIPFDMAASYRPGARFGPASIRKNSVQLCWGALWPYGFKPWERLKIIDYGDLAFDYADTSTAALLIEKQASIIIKDDTSLISLGGDHYISLPLLRAHAKKHGMLSLIHFDAHQDTLIDKPHKIDHGIPFRLAVDEGLIDPDKSIQIGIRTMLDEGSPIHMLDMNWILNNGIGAVIERVIEVVGDNKCYLSFDMDCVDPSCAPGVGTPVVGGLYSREIFAILRGVSQLNFIGMDIVELCPPVDHSEITALLAANIILEYLAIYSNKKGC